MSAETTPLPCPFCGHAGALAFAPGSTFRWLAYSCAGCAVGGEVRVQTLGHGTREEWRAAAEQAAVAEWNRRHTLPLLRPSVPAGYTAEELDRDNPYNAWMHDGG